MYTVQPKKMLTMNILAILREYSDAEHRLTQNRIIELLQRDYEMTVDRKAIKRNLDNLIEAGYDLGFTAIERSSKTDDHETITTDWYINHDFEASELRLLIDSLLFSHQIPSGQCHRLIDKLKGLSNRYFNTRVRHVQSLPEIKATNKQLFFTIDVLDEAISEGRQVSFKYGLYDIDGKLHPRLAEDGEPRIYHIDPYQMVATNGRYYLICRLESHDELAYYRIDRILDIVQLDTPSKPLSDLPGLAGGLNLPTHMAEHIYMFSGPAAPVRFRVRRSSLMHVFDWFGSDVRFSNITEETVEVSVHVNEVAMRYWALQFYEHVEVLAPASLRESLKAAGQSIVDRYADKPGAES